MKFHILPSLFLVGTMVLLTGLLESVATSVSYATDYSLQGPVEFTTQTFKVPLSSEVLIKTYGETMTLYVRLPTSSSSTHGSPPLLWWFSGFQQSSSSYTHLQDRAASWGWVVICYNNPRSKAVSAKTELQLIAYLQQHCLQAPPSPSTSNCPPLLNIDSKTQVTAGHSRGGKIAALAYASSQLNTTIGATFLIDPVDTTNYIPDSDNNPSAAAALAKRGGKGGDNLPIGILGAGILSSCNPTVYVKGGTKTQCQVLEEVAGWGSWSAVAPKTSHSQFADGGWFINGVQDLLCGKGKVSREEVAEIESVCMLNWFWRMGFAPEIEGYDGSPEGAFEKWLMRKMEEGQLDDVMIKGENGKWRSSGGDRLARDTRDDTMIV